MITCTFEEGGNASLRHVVLTTIVNRNNQILLGKRGTYNGKPISEYGKWGPPGGFLERDETIAQAAAREVLEESGWTIKNLKLFRINDNPNRPAEDRQNVDFIYLAEGVKKIGNHDEEVQEQKWFDLVDLPSHEEFAFDHYENIKLYLEYLKKPFPLPCTSIKFSA